MSELDLNTYRFVSGEDPSDEMLAQIMHDVAEKARLKFDSAKKRHTSNSRKRAREKKSEWANKIALALKNG